MSSRSKSQSRQEGHNGSKKMKAWVAAIKYQDGETYFQALQYQEDGKGCVILTNHNLKINSIRKTFDVATKDIIFTPGTPHHNEKVGDLRLDEKNAGCDVHFVGKDFEPFSMHNGSICILFELPDE